MIVLPLQPIFCPDGKAPPADYDTTCQWVDAQGGAHVFTPGGGSEAIPSLADQITGMITTPVEAAAGGIFDAFGQTMAQAFADMLQAALTWWLGPTGVALKPLLNTLSDPAGRNPAGLMVWIAGVVAVFALFAAGINVMLRRRMDDAIDIGIGLFKFVLVYTAGWTVLLGLWNLSDDLTNSILGNQGTDALSAPFTATMTAGIAAQAAPGLMIVLGLIGAILGLFLFFAMLFRIAAIVILAVALPLAAAGAVGSGATKEWLPKVTGWLLALIMFRPLAALVYSIGLELMTRSDGADPVMGMLIGVAVIITTLFSLAALMKLLSWTTGAAVSGGGGAGLALAGAGVAGGMMMRQPGAGAVTASDAAPSPGGVGPSAPAPGGTPTGAAPAGTSGSVPGGPGDPPPGPSTGDDDGGTGGPPLPGGDAGGAGGASDPAASMSGNQVGQSAAVGSESAAATGGTSAGAGGAATGGAAAGGPAGLAAAAAVQAVNLGAQAVSDAANSPARELE